MPLHAGLCATRDCGACSGMTREQHTTTAIDSAKSQTHSAKPAVFGVFSPNGSALWRPHPLNSRPRRHPSGGIALHGGPTRRRHAARRLRVVQNPHHHRHGERQGHGEPGRSAHERQKPDNRTQGRPHFRYKTLPAHPPSPHIRYKTLPAHPPSPHIRYKTLPAHLPSPHVRYKTLPAHLPSPHIRYKTLPAHPKWPNLALFLHAGRVLYRFHHQEAKQGELCTEREAELGLATTALQAPPV